MRKEMRIYNEEIRMLTYANFGIINVVAMKFRDETFEVRFVDWQRVPPANPGTNRIFVNI